MEWKNIEKKEKIKVFTTFIFFIILLISFVDIPVAKFIISFKKKYRFIEIFTSIASPIQMIIINIIILIIYLLENKKIDKNIKVIISTQIIGAILLRTLKFIFGRARPYLLEKYSSTFTLLNINENFASFPSGHAFSTWVLIILLITIFKDFFDRNKFFKYILYIHGVLICLSRILLSMHYLSDVVFGAIIAIIFTKIIIKKLLIFFT